MWLKSLRKITWAGHLKCAYISPEKTILPCFRGFFHSFLFVFIFLILDIYLFILFYVFCFIIFIIFENNKTIKITDEFCRRNFKKSALSAPLDPLPALLPYPLLKPTTSLSYLSSSPPPPFPSPSPSALPSPLQPAPSTASSPLLPVPPPASHPLPPSQFSFTPIQSPSSSSYSPVPIHSSSFASQPTYYSSSFLFFPQEDPAAGNSAQISSFEDILFNNNTHSKNEFPILYHQILQIIHFCQIILFWQIQIRQIREIHQIRQIHQI